MLRLQQGKTTLAFLLLGVSMLFHAPVAQAESVQLSVDTAVRYALDGNLTIKQNDIALRTAQRAKNYSWNSISPSLNLSADVRKSLPKPETSGRSADSSNPASVTLGASVSVRLSPSVYTNVKGAALSYEKSQLDYETTVRTIEMNVRQAFYAMLYQQENVKLQENNVETARKQYSSNQTRYSRGLLPRLDVINSQLAYQNAKVALENARTTLQNDEATFKQLLGLPQSTEITLTGSLDDILSIGAISIDDVEKKSPSIASLQKQIEIAQNNLLAARFSAYGPSLSAGYSYNLSTDTDNLSDWQKNGTLSLGVSIPLDGYLPWSSGAQSIANQKDSIETLQLQLQNARTTLEITAKQDLNKIKQLQANIDLRRSNIDYAKETYDLTVEAYNHGTKDLLALQTASDNLLQARVNLKSEAYSLISAILDLENTIGVSFGTLAK